MCHQIDDLIFIHINIFLYRYPEDKLFNVFEYLTTYIQIDGFRFIHINIFLYRYPEEEMFKVF